MDIERIISEIMPSLSGDFSVTPFKSEEDGSEYSVYKLHSSVGDFVLKKTRNEEISIYETYLQAENSVPKYYGSVELDGESYILLEYIDGESLRICKRERLILALDTLIDLQNRHWNEDEREVGISFEDSLLSRRKRGEYLNDSELEFWYDKFLEKYSILPRTLCHDDLLPFNVIASADRAVIVDWEYAGILPYPTSFARLIAHCEESEDSFFYMTEADKSFAIDYYYEKLLSDKGISYEEYRRTLDLFLLYEYCEWIMLGNRYEDADMERYRDYRNKAKELIKNPKRDGL